MSDQVLNYLAAAAALAGLMAYAVLGGADFGGGVWDLLARGPRKREQREVIAKAIGPVWEANHVWLIFVIVVLFTCFPNGYGPLMTALFLPLHLVLVGIILRGAAFVFRGYGPQRKDSGSEHHPVNPATAWGAVFGAASIISPVILGASFGVVTAGDVRIDGSGVTVASFPWLRPYPLACGALALSTCAYLAAVYLVVETEDQPALRRDFRRRAIVAGTITAILAVVVLIVARFEATWFVAQLQSIRALPVLIAGGIAFAVSAAAVFSSWDRIARISAAAQVILMLLGWGMAHRDYLIYPDMTLAKAAAPPATIKFMLVATLIGLIPLLPSLWLLFRVFKSSDHGKTKY